jgi:hypothetical protein
MTAPYPSKGVALRDFLKAYKEGQPAAVKVGHKPGLYYFTGDLPPRFKRGEHKGFDNQIKIGAAGLKSNTSKSDTAEWSSRKSSMPRSKIAGRLQMYAGHQGVYNPRLLGVRVMNYGTKHNGKNFNVEMAEDAMKDVMKQLAKPPSAGGHPGIKGGEEHAYEGHMDAAGEYHYTGTKSPEWFLVDWDKVHEGRTPHQAILAAMGNYPLEKMRPKHNSHSEQYLVQTQKNKYPKLTLLENPEAVQQGVTTKSAPQRRARTLELKEELQRHIQQQRELERELWYARQN